MTYNRRVILVACPTKHQRIILGAWAAVVRRPDEKVHEGAELKISH
jgi:hypothetical protein